LDLDNILQACQRREWVEGETEYTLDITWNLPISGYLFSFFSGEYLN